MHLTDCFMELIAYVIYFKRSANTKQPHYDQVRADVLRFLNKSEDFAKKGNFSQEDYGQARFMICAWVDETILSSSWDKKDQWRTEQLQRVYYNTFEAGEEVFERLNNLGLHQREVREVYYICLSLGFLGRYCHKGDDYLLDQLKSQNLKLLMGSSVGLPSLERAELFPEAYPRDTTDVSKRGHGLSLFTIAFLVGSVLFGGILFFIYRFVLASISDNIL